MFSNLPTQVRLARALRQWKEKRSCSSEQCRSPRWRRISSRAGSIDLNGREYCFPECFERELQRRLERLQAPLPGTAGPAQHRIPLGLLMLSRGDLNHAQLQLALAEQRRTQTGRIGEWAQKLGFIGERQVSAALAAQFGCPWIGRLPVMPIEAPVPFTLLKQFNMAPVYRVKPVNTLYMAFAGAVDYGALLAIEQVLQCRTEACVADATGLQQLLQRTEEQWGHSDVALESVSLRSEMVRICSSYAEKTSAECVRLAACSEQLWVRVIARNSAVNLVFPWN